MNKQCSKCKGIKPLSRFHTNNRSKDGKLSHCIDCHKKYYKDNQEKIREDSRLYKKKNKEIIKERDKLYREKNKGVIKERGKKYYKNNKRTIQKYYETHRERVKKRKKEYDRKYNERNRAKRKQQYEARKEQYNKWEREHRKNPFIRLNDNISSIISRSLRGNKNGRHWETIVGYKLGELKEHLENLFQSGMNWENYGKWHVDHIIPISLWEFESPDDSEFKQCWALCNLQPLWAEENMRKSNNVA